MNDLQATQKSIRNHIFLSFILENLVFGLSLYVGIYTLKWKLPYDFAFASGIALLFILVIGAVLSQFITQPLKALWDAIIHISPNSTEITKAPDIQKLEIGRALITNLVGQLYQISNVAQHEALTTGTTATHTTVDREFIANTMPLPLFVLDGQQNIVFANAAAAQYIGISETDLIGKNVYMILDMSFPSNDTFDSWLKKVEEDSVTAFNVWERVRLNIRDNHPTLLFDLAAYYNRDNPDGNSSFIILFDHTKQYSQDDQAVSFVALSVHELRTPLTLLRGYIEVFDQELASQLDDEQKDFMIKMKAASQELAAFVDNILNVARVDNDQLQLKLSEEDWKEVLSHAIQTINLRAKVRGITIELTIADDLPKVGIDRLSIQEVINNLIDNAIKYSGTSKLIKVNSGLNKEGFIETTVQDFGVGIPTSVVSKLFTKYYRDHRNRAQIGGTGLGLYLTKAIISAHGGNVWVKSTEGKGSTFGFTVQTYENVKKDNEKRDSNDEIIRNAHGWIKNHSYYLR